jgi:hypothetical protein
MPRRFATAAGPNLARSCLICAAIDADGSALVFAGGLCLGDALALPLQHDLPGSFSDPRIGISVTQTPDMVTPKLPALLKYQLGLRTPDPPEGSFDEAAARRGERLFKGAAECSSCHKPPLFTDVLSGPDHSVPFLHSPAEVGQDPVYASRSATKMYRTTPLRALWQHPPYFHDGSAADLLAVVNHYDSLFQLRLKDNQKADLVEFLKTL